MLTQLKRRIGFSPSMSSDGQTIRLWVPMQTDEGLPYNLELLLEPHEVAFLVAQGAKCLASEVLKY